MEDDVELVPVVEAGLKLAMTPAGNPLAVKATPSAKPPARLIVSALVPLAPCATSKLAGFAESAKSDELPLEPPVTVSDTSAGR